MVKAEPGGWIATAALAQIGCGAVLGLADAPFALFSSSLVEITGAGLGALTGAVLMGGGFVTLAVLSAQRTPDSSRVSR